MIGAALWRSAKGKPWRLSVLRVQITCLSILTSTYFAMIRIT